LLLYRVLLSLVFPALLGRALWQALRHGRLGDLNERLGAAPSLPGDSRAPLIWLHGASNGELASARPLIDALCARDPALHLHCTANSTTGRALVQSWGLPRVTATLAPLDHRAVLARFLRRWPARALVSLENEIWPNRFAACAAHRIPVIIAGARLSERAARRWTLLPGLARAVLARLAWVAPQDQDSADRLVRLGLTRDRIGPVLSLKALVPQTGPAVGQTPAAGVPATPTAPRDAWPFARTRTILAASTHDGEEAIILDAFAAAQARDPALSLIIAPRHPRRRDAIEALIRARSLPHATRSRGQAPRAAPAVYLADTLGEMAAWYAAAGITFVGGSFVPRGGHTPFEPAAAGSAILHGPDVANFADAYAALAAAGAAVTVTDAATLAAALLDTDPMAQQRRAAAARVALARFGGPAALTPLVALIARAARLAPDPHAAA
jgi:3-deoxy-D-manno-octulosonic-acid transferase